MTQPQTDFTDDQLLSHARRLSDEFSGRAAEFDLARKLAQDASDAMAHAGFYRLFVPRYLGGLEASPLVSAQIFERLAQCGLRLGSLYRSHKWIDLG